jgi:hypothetical protein
MGGTNYDIHAHSPVFWVVYLAVAITATVALMGLFLYGVARSNDGARRHRSSQ